jgi:PhnB protein
MAVEPIPARYGSVTANLVVDGGAAALEFYEQAFGAEVVMRLVGPGGKIMHSEIRIGDTLLTVSDQMEEYGLRAPDPSEPVASSMMIYCDDARALHARAVAAGATKVSDVEDHFHGDRAGSLRDPFGHRWIVATNIEDVSEAEMQRRMEEWLATAAG